jgi:hypothetical protein
MMLVIFVEPTRITFEYFSPITETFTAIPATRLSLVVNGTIYPPHYYMASEVQSLHVIDNITPSTTTTMNDGNDDDVMDTVPVSMRPAMMLVLITKYSTSNYHSERWPGYMINLGDYNTVDDLINTDTNIADDTDTAVTTATQQQQPLQPSVPVQPVHVPLLWSPLPSLPPNYSNEDNQPTDYHYCLKCITVASQPQPEQ